MRHPCRGIFANQDAFPGGNSSLACSFVPQGLFLPSGCIPGMLFCSTGIISSVRMHPRYALLFHRDYFFRPDASQACSFVPQGLFLPSECIPGMLFCSTGIISFVRMHLWHAFLFRRMHPNAEIHPCRDISANQDAAAKQIQIKMKPRQISECTDSCDI